MQFSVTAVLLAVVAVICVAIPSRLTEVVNLASSTALHCIPSVLCIVAWIVHQEQSAARWMVADLPALLAELWADVLQVDTVTVAVGCGLYLMLWWVALIVAAPVFDFFSPYVHMIPVAYREVTIGTMEVNLTPFMLVGCAVLVMTPPTSIFLRSDPIYYAILNFHAATQILRDCAVEELCAVEDDHECWICKVTTYV